MGQELLFHVGAGTALRDPDVLTRWARKVVEGHDLSLPRPAPNDPFAITQCPSW